MKIDEINALPEKMESWPERLRMAAAHGFTAAPIFEVATEIERAIPAARAACTVAAAVQEESDRRGREGGGGGPYDPYPPINIGMRS